MSDDPLPPLRDVIREHGLAARKSLGQNFILDLNLTGRIARVAGSLDDAIVIEVGPGPGGLTRALLANGVRKVIAIERDGRCLPALEEIARAYPGRLNVVSADALSVDMAGLAAQEARHVAENSPTVENPTVLRRRIVANLPYSVATPLLIQWLSTSPWPPWYESMTLMFQKEVGERIVAAPDTPAYGRLSVLAQARCQARIALRLPARAFTPPPKVESVLVHFTPEPVPLWPGAVKPLERITAAAFGQRRKMLRSSLRAVFDDPTAELEALGINPQARAETLEVSAFCRLADALERQTARG